MLYIMSFWLSHMIAAQDNQSYRIKKI